MSTNTPVRIRSSAKDEVDKLVSSVRDGRKDLGIQPWVRDAKCRNIVLLSSEEIKELEDKGIDPLLENQKRVSNMFFPEQGQPVDQAVAICNTCPVELECLQYSLDRKEKMGVWGGFPERTRRRIKRQKHILKTNKQKLDNGTNSVQNL